MQYNRVVSERKFLARIFTPANKAAFGSNDEVARRPNEANRLSQQT